MLQASSSKRERHGQTAVLRLLQEGTDAPILSASLRLVRGSASGSPDSWDTLAHFDSPGPGQWSLPMGLGLLTLRSDGYATSVLLLNLGPDGAAIRLAKAAELRLSFVPARAGALLDLQDLEVAIAPPAAEEHVGRGGVSALPLADEGEIGSLERSIVASGELTAENEALLEVYSITHFRKLEGNEVAWHDLPPGGPYRWVANCPSALFFEPRPEHEQEAVVRQPSGRFLVQGEPPPFVSGRFDLQGGTTTSFEVPLTVTGVVRGRVLARLGDGDPPPTVSVLDRQVYANLGGGEFRRRVTEATMSTDLAGRFRISGVREGDKLLRASWLEGIDHAFFARRDFRMEEGHTVDLGDIAPLGGPGQLIVASLRDADANLVAAHEVFEADPVPAPIIVVTWTPEGGLPEEGVLAQVPLTFNTQTVLHGIGQGRLRLEVVPSDWRLRPGYALACPPDAEVVAPTRDPIELVFALTLAVETRFELDGLEGREDFRCLVWARARTGEETMRLKLRGRRGVTTTGVSMVPGEYEAIVQDIGNDDMALCYAGPILIGPEGKAEIVMQPGASLTGLALQEDGQPLRAAPVFLKPTQWPECQSATTTDMDGRFAFRGLVPRLTYSFSNGTTVVLGEPGTSLDVRVTSPNRFPDAAPERR